MRARGFPAPVHQLGRRRCGGLDELLARVAARAEHDAEERGRERAAAVPLARELQALPEAERVEAVEQEPRFWTLGLAEHLLQAAEAGGAGEAADAEEPWLLLDLALAIVRRLPVERYGESLLVEQEVRAWCLRAERHRRNGDFPAAEESFGAAAHRLAGELFLDGPERAVYCRYLARLRRDQDRPDEALALLRRAADLFAAWSEPWAAGEALSEAGWLCLEEGDAPSAQPLLEQAALLLHAAPRPALAIRALHGLALCSAELGHPADAEEALARAGRLHEEAPGVVERLRYRATEARVALHLGQAKRAEGLLASALSGLLARGAFHDAAVAALDLAELHHARGNRPALEDLVQETVCLGRPGALPEHLRAVWLLAVRFARRRAPDATELLACAGEFLDRARERPWLRFGVGRPSHADLSWDLLDEGFRRYLCEEAGVPVATTDLSAADVPVAQTLLLSWTYELLAGVRIVFDPVPPAPF